jgi:uncharacterized protein (TIGR02271 family)
LIDRLHPITIRSHSFHHLRINPEHKGHAMAYQETTNAAGVGTITPVIVALFDDANDAHLAVTQLRDSGFSSSQIGAAFRGDSIGRYTEPNVTSTGTVKHDGETWWEKVKDAFRPAEQKVETHREVAADTDIEFDPYTRNDHEYDFADRDFEGSLAGTGIPADRSAYLTRNLRRGGAIVTVREADRAAEAEQILAANNGKVRYEDAADAVGTDYSGVDTAGATIDAADSTGREVTDTGYVDQGSEVSSVASADRVQLFGEVLRVHKERVNRGEVRLRKDVVTENQTVEVPITREELVLERVAVSSDTPAPSANIGRGQEIRIPLAEDRVRVEKVPVVKEEVLVGKRDVADVARVGEDVRREELRVDSDVETPRRTVVGEEVSDDLRRRVN